LLYERCVHSVAGVLFHVPGCNRKVESNTGRSEESAVNLEFFQNNFGGYVLAGAVVLVEYAALTAFAPRLATPILMVTALGIILYWYAHR